MEQHSCDWSGKTDGQQRLPYVCPNRAVYRIDWPDDVDESPTHACRMHMGTFVERILEADTWVTVQKLDRHGEAVKPVLTVHEGGVR